jgi:hypothetical protein
MDSLFFGVLLSYWHHFHSDKFTASIKKIRPFLFPVSLLLILPAMILVRQKKSWVDSGSGSLPSE